MSVLVSIAVARFGGWLQPWTVALIVGLPALVLFVYRAGDLRRWVQNKAWHRRAHQDGRDR